MVTSSASRDSVRRTLQDLSTSRQALAAMVNSHDFRFPPLNRPIFRKAEKKASWVASSAAGASPSMRRAML